MYILVFFFIYCHALVIILQHQLLKKCIKVLFMFYEHVGKKSKSSNDIPNISGYHNNSHCFRATLHNNSNVTSKMSQ